MVRYVDKQVTHPLIVARLLLACRTVLYMYNEPFFLFFFFDKGGVLNGNY